MITPRAIINYPARTEAIEGVFLELDNGVLVCASQSTPTIKRSADGGLTWTTVHTYSTSTFRARGTFIDSRGYVFIGIQDSSPWTVQAKIARSTDNGLTFTEIKTVDSSCVWHFAEDASGNLFASEYSLGLKDINELYAYNVWKSTDAGATWSKWFTYPNTNIRHIHLFAIDAQGNKYISWGDAPGFSEAGKTYRIGDDGVLGDLISDSVGNGWTSYANTSDNMVCFGGDLLPYAVYKYDPSDNSFTTPLTLNERFGEFHSNVMLNMLTGKHGVLYASTNRNVGNGIRPGVLISPDDGETWGLIKYTAEIPAMFRLTLNRNREGSRVYIGHELGGATRSLPDFTIEEANNLLYQRVPVS